MCPARDITAARKSRVIRRDGIYAARATVRAMQHNGQTARDAYMRPLQTCR
nr:MAG TPA: hypothetical protein [Caudoviricetes sp.]